LIFDGPTLEWDDVRRDCGERRIQAIGQVGEDVLFVVYTWRGRGTPRGGAAWGPHSVRRIISARLANRRECDAYREAFE
jgi:uncharacterized DUF497 family protein